MRKVDEGGKTGKTRRKLISFIVATNAVASGQPERRPTGTPTTRAKNCKLRTTKNECDLKSKGVVMFYTQLSLNFIKVFSLFIG